MLLFLFISYITIHPAGHNNHYRCAIVNVLPSCYTWVCEMTFDYCLGSTRTLEAPSNAPKLRIVLPHACVYAQGVGGSECATMEMEYNKVAGTLAAIFCNKHSAWCLMKAVYRFQTMACPGNALEGCVCVSVLFDTYKIL